MLERLEEGLEGKYEEVLRAAEELRVVMKGVEDGSHGVGHAVDVALHGLRAVEEEEEEGRMDKAAVLLACLLHDADDPKVFPKQNDTEKHANLLTILTAIGIDPERRETVTNMVQLVSTRDNRNDSPDNIPLWWLIPRYCDRLEAIGRKGLARCFQYNKEANRPLSLPSTLRATSSEHLYSAVAPASRFASYRGNSVSLVDHCYDKLLHINVPSTSNPYIKRSFEASRGVIEDFCLDFSRTGTVDEAYLSLLVEEMQNKPR